MCFLNVNIFLYIDTTQNNSQNPHGTKEKGYIRNKQQLYIFLIFSAIQASFRDESI